MVLDLFTLSNSVLFCTKFCQSISKSFRATGLNSRVSPRVVTINKGA